jgi:diacylglycerol kinase
MKKRIESFKHAIRGIRMVLSTEKNMQIHLIFVILVVFFGLLFSISRLEWMICLLAFGLVMGAEMLNTAIETVVDLVSPEYHQLAGKAKDIAAGAVLVASVFAAIAGLIIFVPRGVALGINIWIYLFR